MAARARPYLLLAAVWAAYFAPLFLHPSGVLYSDRSDFLAAHLPAKLAAARDWERTGELPLWCPYQFCGIPYVHDVQFGAFYPPNFVALLMPERLVGPVLSWGVALHLLAAGWFLYAYARSNGLGEAAGLVAAGGLMFAPKWLAHLFVAGHTVTTGLAWLPLVLLGLETAIRTGRAGPAAGAGAAYALILLGTHPQWALYAGGLAAAWTLPAAIAAHGWSARGLARWAGAGAVAVLVAALLAAVQLGPAVEASRYSTRAVGAATPSEPEVGYLLLRLVGPPPHPGGDTDWEFRGWVPALWLAAAAAAPLLAGSVALGRAAVLVGLVALVVGGAGVFAALPGFNLFRSPARLLLLAPLPLAYLAGVTTQRLVETGWSPAGRRGLRLALGVTLVGAMAPTAWAGIGTEDGPVNPTAVVYAVVLAAAFSVALLLAVGAGRPRLRTGLWVAVLAADLFAAGGYPVEVRDLEDVYPVTPAEEVMLARSAVGRDRLLAWTAPGPDPAGAFGAGAQLALVRGFETPVGFNPLDVRAYREFLQYVIDDPWPARAFTPMTSPTVPNLPVRHWPLFHLLGVRYLTCPADVAVNPDQWRPVADAPGGRAFSHTGGVRALPPHRVYECPHAAPRVVVVGAAAAVPADPASDGRAGFRAIARLAGTDFRTTVLLDTTDPLPPPLPGPAGTATITDYRPNRVTVRLDECRGGFLVLHDVWYPGWVGRVDGEAVPVYRANHAFRAVPLRPGATEAVFSFEPQSYLVGRWVSLGAGVVLLLTAFRRAVRC